MVTPRDKVRRSIIERNRYNPESPEKALRASVPGWKGTFQPIERKAGDIEIPSMGVAYGKSTGPSGS